MNIFISVLGPFFLRAASLRCQGEKAFKGGGQEIKEPLTRQLRLSLSPESPVPYLLIGQDCLLPASCLNKLF